MFSSSEVSPSDLLIDLRTGKIHVFNLEPHYSVDHNLFHFASVTSVPFRFLYPYIV